MSRITELLKKIQIERITILPPYTYDEDEEEKGLEEYLIFYTKEIEQAIKASREYINAISRLNENPDDLKIQQELLAARRNYINYFPFCYDEVEVGSASEKEVIRICQNQGRNSIGGLQDYHNTISEIQNILQRNGSESRKPKHKVK